MLPGTITPDAPRRVTDPATVVAALSEAKEAIVADYAALDQLREQAHSIGTEAVAAAHRIGGALEQAAQIAGPRYFRTWAEGNLPFSLAIAEKFRKVRALPPDSRQTWLALDLVPERVETVGTEADAPEVTKRDRDGSDEPREAKPAPHLRAIDDVLAWASTVRRPGVIERGDTRQLYALLHEWHAGKLAR
jgi:hypothetical protein